LGAAGSGTNTGVCKYSISAPGQLALIDIPVTATATTTTGFPLDPVPANNTATGSVRVQSSGKFTTLPPPQSFVVNQQWSNPTDASLPTATAMIDPTGSVSNQQLNVIQLALLVVPTHTQLGVFNLETTVYTKTAAGDSIFMGTGTVPLASGAGPLALQPLGPGDALGGTTCAQVTAVSLGVAQSGLAYDGKICASTSGATNQQIAVSYNLTSGGGVTGVNARLFRDNTFMKIKMRFNLDPTATVANDSVTATIQVPANKLVASCGGDIFGNPPPPFFCQTSFQPAIITTP
jgi:hypothetical protein